MAEPEEDRAVINFFSRKPHVEPARAPVEEQVSAVDDDAVSALEELLAEAKAGKVHGVVILAGFPNDDGSIAFVRTCISDEAYISDQIFIGACHTAASEIITMTIADMVDDDD